MAMLAWTVEIFVDSSWVADGFELTDERMHDIMTDHLAYAHGDEIECKVFSKPSSNRIAKLQGYSSAADKKKRGEA